ncbi:MAG: hypothetical protein LBQ59_03900 [Candidatus Peribacteria bacterium]|nr:hypothetical protein [Candidatus Peribacteria bacterium]
MEELGYDVNSLWLYSMKDNKKYRVYKPSDSELIKFQNFLEKYRKFDPSAK